MQYTKINAHHSPPRMEDVKRRRTRTLRVRLPLHLGING
jgi:hypothetical protein